MCVVFNLINNLGIIMMKWKIKTKKLKLPLDLFVNWTNENWSSIIENNIKKLCDALCWIRNIAKLSKFSLEVKDWSSMALVL